MIKPKNKNFFYYYVIILDPPEVDTNVRTQFKIPIGTKPFKLSCPIKSESVIDGTIIRWTKDEEEVNL